jgi:hypothetical protein
MVIFSSGILSAFLVNDTICGATIARQHLDNSTILAGVTAVLSANLGLDRLTLVGICK